MITENIVGFDTRGGSTFVQGVEASIQTYLAEKFTIADPVSYTHLTLPTSDLV